MIIANKKMVRFMMIAVLFLSGIALGFTGLVSADLVETTIFEEGFEDWPEGDILPSSNWDSNTGWLDGETMGYGLPFNGQGWAFSWTKGDNLSSIPISFGSDTELSFWYKPENTLTPMSLDVYIDYSIKIWSKSDFQNLNYAEASVDLSNYSGEHTISFVCNKSSLNYGLLLDYITITSYIEDDDTPSSGDNGGGSPPITPPAENNPPIANLSEGEPYQGFTNESILFDGSLSSDLDEGDEIIKYIWDFGDGTSKPGITANHAYESPGTYTVELRVIDSNGADDVASTTATIQQGNNPPSIPRLSQEGSFSIEKVIILKNQSGYAGFSVSSTDSDGDLIELTIDWDDGNKETQLGLQSGKAISINHTWANPGRYDVSIIATDENDASSEAVHQIVFMNLNVEKISGDLSGYLFSEANQNNYSHFYHPEKDIETEVEIDENGQYLIDSNGDDDWDYVFNITTGITVYKASKDDSGLDDEGSSDTPGFEIMILVAASWLFVYIKRKR